MTQDTVGGYGRSEATEAPREGVPILEAPPTGNPIRQKNRSYSPSSFGSEAPIVLLSTSAMRNMLETMG